MKRTKGMLLAGGLLVLLFSGCSAAVRVSEPGAAAGEVRTEVGTGPEEKSVSSEAEEEEVCEEGKVCEEEKTRGERNAGEEGKICGEENAREETKGRKEIGEAERFGQKETRAETGSSLAVRKGVREATARTGGGSRVLEQQAESRNAGDAQAEDSSLPAGGVAGKRGASGSVSRSGKDTQRSGAAAKGVSSSISSKKPSFQADQPAGNQTRTVAGSTPAKETSGPESPASSRKETSSAVPKETSVSVPKEASAPVLEETHRPAEPTAKPSEETPAAETPAPAPPEPAEVPEEPAPRGPYDYAFDIGAIQADGIAVGQSMGYAWDASLTPANASWWNPVTASETHQGAALKQSLESYIRFHTAENLAPYGMEAVTAFHIYCEPRGNGVYSIYFLFV